MQLQAISLFSGIEGFGLALHWLGIKTIVHVEKEKFAASVLKKRFPDAELFDDIKNFDAKKYKGKCQIITAGFPCQPHSVAGHRLGEDDPRFLWAETLESVRQIRPRLFIAENVFGIKSMANGTTFEKICADLEETGYTVCPFVLPTIGIGGWHIRRRFFFIAYIAGE